MCLQLGLGLAEAGLGFLSSKAQADAQNAYAISNAHAANEAATFKYGQELAALREEEANATRERIEAVKNTLTVSGTALASGQNEGVSTNLVSRDIARQGAEQIGLVDSNIILRRQEGADKMLAAHAEAKNRIASVETTAGPSVLSLAVAGLGAAANAGMFEGGKALTEGGVKGLKGSAKGASTLPDKYFIPTDNRLQVPRNTSKTGVPHYGGDGLFDPANTVGRYPYLARKNGRK